VSFGGPLLPSLPRFSLVFGIRLRPSFETNSPPFSRLLSVPPIGYSVKCLDPQAVMILRLAPFVSMMFPFLDFSALNFLEEC